jgi:hypothetical protein
LCTVYSLCDHAFVSHKFDVRYPYPDTPSQHDIMESPGKFRISSNKSPQTSPRKEDRRCSLDSLDGDLKSLKSAPKSARLRFLRATEAHPSGPRKPTPRPSPAALAAVENEEKKGDDGGDLTLSQKNRLEVRSLFGVQLLVFAAAHSMVSFALVTVFRNC